MNKQTRILLVDDDEAILDVYSQLLELEGYEVWQASSGLQGLQMTRERHPHLVLLDVMLPDMSGLEVCRQIKTDSTLPDVFVALFSGEATSGAHKIHGAETGADDYIVKPVGREELLARIRTLIRLRDTTVALRASEQHYRTLVEILPDAVCLMDPEGRLDAINPQGLAMLGYQGQEEVLGRTLYNFAPADEHDRIRADLATVLHSGLIRGLEYTLLRNDGRRVPVELSATILKEEKGQTLELVAVMRDISRRKRAEEQIRVLADAVQSAQELISITDQENRLTFANQAFLQAYGYEEKEVLGKTPDMLRANANPLELTKQLYLQTMQGGWRGELMDRRRNGMEFPVSLATSPIRNSKGQTIGFVWLGRDITERRRVEKQHTAFAQLGYRLSGATTAPEAAKIILDIASDLFGWDAGYVQAYSVADDRMLSLLAVDTIQGRKAPITSDPAEPPSALKREVMKEGGRLVNGDGVPSQSSELISRGDTTRISASMMYVPIHSAGTAIGLLSIKSYKANAYTQDDLRILQTLANYCGDALQRIQAVEALDESRRLQKAILDNIPDPAWYKDALGRFMACNEALAKLIGKRIEDILGRTVFDLQLPDAARLHREDVEVMRVGKPAKYEGQRTDPSGRVRWFETSKSPLLGESGEIAGTVGIARDVTERKKAEDELWKLPRRIIEAQEAERLRVSRELHDGVNQLIASAQIRLRRVEGMMPDFRPAAREILARCSDLLVQALEENRRIAHNLRPGELDQLGLTTACRHLCKQFHSRTNVAVKCHITKLGNRLSQAAELNLFRIVQEAFNNVEKHARAKTLHLRISLQDDMLTLTIQDDGSGFAPRKAKAARGKGSGVGLNNIRERVEALGGTYEIKSAPTEGTTLIVNVPCKSSD